jgi:hypothetical protein
VDFPVQTALLDFMSLSLGLSSRCCSGFAWWDLESTSDSSRRLRRLTTGAELHTFVGGSGPPEKPAT